MVNPPRRVPAPNPHQYYAAVPQSPRSASYNRSSSRVAPARYPTRTPSGGSASASTTALNRVAGQRDAARGVATGAIGNGYGPYSYEPTNAREYAGSSYDRANDRSQYTTQYSSTHETHETYAVTPVEKAASSAAALPVVNTSTVPAYLWDTKDPDLDDPLHNPDPVRDAKLDHSFTLWSSRGWANALMLFAIVVGLLILFGGYPIIVATNKSPMRASGYNIGGVNATGQIPSLPGLPTLIDADTPTDFLVRTGTDGNKYNLIFSDEFNVDGRTFWPGDDAYWEAVDLNYWPTGDLEWYDPGAITTQDGKLVITMTEMKNHDLNFQSGMLSSWNKFCFTTGYVEISVSMPGSPQAPGLWPAAWTLGNLGRAGYGATTDGLWPYTYDSCDTGTFPNQMNKDGSPAAAATGGSGGGKISALPGQRLSACTCPGSDHPGPSVAKGRGAPEIDIFETQIDTSIFRGQVSQSLQTAPYNNRYQAVNTTPAINIYDTDLTRLNTYKGGPYQQAVSAVTYIDNQNYDNMGYASYGFEWWSNPRNRDEGYVTWFSDGSKTWTATAASTGPDSTMGIGQRLISEEPHYIIFNLGMSPDFQRQDFKHMQFPAKMYIDYIRVYQREGVDDGVGCNPRSHPTTRYINKHMTAYTNPNLTTWAQANETFPRNSLYDNCY